MNERKTSNASADHWTDAEYQGLVHQIANRLVNGAMPGQVAGDLQQEHGWSPKAAMEVVRDAQKRMANEGSQILEELDAEQERKSGERGLIGKVVYGLLTVVSGVATYLLLAFGWGSWVLWGLVGIGVAAGVVKVLVGLVRRRRRKEEQELVLLRHGTELDRNGRSEVGQASATTASQDPVSVCEGTRCRRRFDHAREAARRGEA